MTINPAQPSGDYQPTREEVHDLLVNWQDYEWQVQGFGMLRTYLPGEGEPRLQVWDQRLATWSNNAIHDHPWSFRSTIYAGLLYNQRYDIPSTGLQGNGHITEIIPGTRGGKLSERPVRTCRLVPKPVEVYTMGEFYGQTHREMHLTRYLPGTVTLITRFDREEEDIARVAWYGRADEQPPFVNPYPAPPELAELVIGDALRAWWLPESLCPPNGRAEDL